MHHKFLHYEQHGEGMRHLTRAFQRFFAFVTLGLAVVLPVFAEVPTPEMCSDKYYDYTTGEYPRNCDEMSDALQEFGIQLSSDGCACKCSNDGIFNPSAANACADNGEHCDLVCNNEIEYNKCDTPGMHPYFISEEEVQCCYYYDPDHGCIDDLEGWNYFVSNLEEGVLEDPEQGAYVGPDYAIHQCPDGSIPGDDPEKGPCVCEYGNFNMEMGWCEKQVTLYKNNGTYSIYGNVSCVYGQTCNFGTATGISQTGYTFTGGWGTTSSCTETTYSFTTPTEPQYYACKTANQYTITLDTSDKNAQAGTTAIYTTYNTGVYLNSNRTLGMTTASNPVTVPSLSGGVFLGYYEAQNGTTQYINANGYITQAGINAAKATTASNTKWYAKWQTNSSTYTITLSGGTGGSGSISAVGNVKYLNNQQMTTSANPVLVPSQASQVAFLGYFSASSGGTKYIDENGYITTAGISAAVSGNTTWHAQFSSTCYVIDLDNTTYCNNVGNLPSRLYHSSTCGNSSCPIYTNASCTAQFTGFNSNSLPSKTNATFMGYAAWIGSTRPGVISSTGSLAATPADLGNFISVPWKAICACNAGYQGNDNVSTSLGNVTASACARGVTISLNDNSGSGGSAQIYTNANGVYQGEDHSSQIGTGANCSNPVNVPTRTNYTFQGYYSGSTSGEKYIDENGCLTTTGNTTGAGYTSNQTWYAHWAEITYTVQYAAGDGGTGSMNSSTISVGGTFTVPTPTTITKPNATFNGWAVSGTSDVKQAGASFTWNYTENKTFTAQWLCDAGFYYNSTNSSCVPCAAGKYKSGTGNTTSCTNINAGYYSTGCGTNATGGVCSNSYSGGVCESGYSSAGTGTSASCTACTTGYTASGNSAGNHDNENDCKATITLKKNGGTGTIQTIGGQTDASVQCSQGVACSFGTASLSQSGYTFVGGWGTISSCTETTYSFTTPTEPKYYACKTANKYTVTLDKNGGTTAGTSSVTATFDSPMPSIATLPTRTNWTFVGYYDATSGGTQYYDGNGNSTNIWDKTANTTLYARWSQNSVTITLNKNGGSGTCSTSVMCNAGESCNLPQWDATSCNITNGNKIFVGWSTSSGAASGTFTVSNANTATYYAVWATPSCNISNASSANPTTPTNNAPNCSVTCGTGYHFGNGANSTTTGTVSGTAGNTSVSSSDACVLNQYTVTFKTGNTNIGTMTVNHGEATALSSVSSLSSNIPAALKSNGWGFNGWATTYNTATSNYSDAATVAFTGNTTLYGIWKRDIPYNYYSNNTTLTSPNHTQYYHNTSGTAAGPTSINLPAINTVTNWTPLGWVTSTISTSPTGNVSSQTSVTPAYDSGVPTYYALYNRTATLAYNGNGYTDGATTNTTGTQYYTAGVGAHALNMTLKSNGFTKLGHTFNGWRLGSDTGALKTEGESITFPNNEWSSNSSYNIYATWEPKTIVLAWDLGGHGSIDPTECTYGETVTLPSPTDTGYTFSKWQTPNNSLFNAGASMACDEINLGTNAINDGNAQITAQWTQNIYRLTVNAGRGIASVSGDGWTVAADGKSMQKDVVYGETVNFVSGNFFVMGGYESGLMYTKTSGAGTLSGSTFTAGLGNATITVQSTGIVSPTGVLTRKWDVAPYNSSSVNVLTATFDTGDYDSSLTIQYNFGISGASNSSSCAAVAYTYANAFSTLGTGATTVTKNVPATEYLGYKCYTIQAKACDGTGCSATTTSSALALGNLQIQITFTKVGSDTSLSGTNPAYARYDTNQLYTTATGTAVTNIPTAYKTSAAQVFKGWYTQQSGGTQVYSANTAALQASVSNITNSSSKWIVTSNKTLYAQYEACSCTPGSNVASCVVNTTSGNLPKDNDNKCSYTYTCTSGFYTAGNSGSGTFDGAAGVGANTSPACGAGSYDITYVLNGGNATGTYQTSAVTDEIINITTPTHPHGTFNGWTISGMDTNTHEYGVTSSLGSSSTAQTLTVGDTIKYFKNLRKSSGTVTFTANWNCATGYQNGNSCAIQSVTCSAGQYLPKNTVACASCPAGKYCATSGTYQYNTTTDQGITGTCTAGNYAAGGATSCSACATNANSNAGASYCTCKSGYSIGGGTSTTMYSTSTPNGSGCALRSYTITLNKNGGSGKIASDTAVTQSNATMTCTYTQTCNLPVYSSTTALSKGTGGNSKIFLGWSTTQNANDDATNAEFKNSYKLSDPGAKILYAVWGTPQCTKGTGVNTTSLNSVSGNKPVCNRSSIAGYYCSATQTGGSAGDLTLETTCTKADAGYYAAAGATGQTACGNGKYSAAGVASCTDCPSLSGWTVTTATTTSTSYSACYATQTPVNCNSGTVKRQASNTTTYSTTVEPVTSLTANSGYYVNATDTACLACVQGAISATGATQCTACQNGTTTTGSGQSTCNAACSNATGVASWATAVWNTNNTVSNLCTVGSMNSYTITLNDNNGSGGVESVSATYGNAMPTITTLPTRVGYAFAGYWDEADGGTQYYNSNGTSARNWDKTSNDTLYAHWNIMSYEITIVAGRGIATIAQPTNGGWTGSGTATLTKTVEYGSTIDLSTFNPTSKAGYTGTGYTVTGAGTLSGSTFTVGANTATITISATGIAAPTAAISMSGISGSTRTLGYNSGTTTTLVGTNTTNYDSGITLSYSYGNSTSASGTYTYSSSNTVDSTAYHGTRYHKVKITASDGTLTSATTTSSGYVTISLNNTKVIFNPNTGTLSGTSPLYVWKNNAALRTSVGGTGTGTVPSATKQGYAFKGWYTQSSGGTQIYNASGTLSTATVSGYISGGKWNVTNLNDITLYAQYEASGNIAYTVNHYTQDLTGNAYTLESTVTGYGTTGATLTLSNLTHSITGFTSPDTGFAGTATNSTTKPSSGAVETTTILAGGNRVIDLYYTRNSYEVAETHGTGIASVSGTGSYLFGAEVQLTAAVSDGYTFTNWTDNNNSNAQVSTDAAYTFTMPANDVSYRANATPNSYNITLNKQSGTGGTSSVSVTYGYTMPAITQPTRGTYTFGGYYTGTSGSGTKYYNADGTSANNWAETNVTTLYAKWTACAACAPGNGANCSLSVVNNTCTYTTSCKTGYSNIQNNGKYNPSCTPNTINITLDKNGGTGTCGGTSGTANGAMTCAYDSDCNAPVWGDNSRIPAEYTEVEYIQSTGSQYIDTGYKPNTNTELTGKIYATTSSQYVYGVHPSSNTKAFSAYVNGNWRFSNKAISTSGKISLKTDYTVKHNKTGLWLNGSSIGTYSSPASFTADYNLYLFATNTGTSKSYGTGIRIYDLQIKDNGVLVRDFVPVKRNSDGKYGLFDTVNRVFYPNANASGANFTAGAVVASTGNAGICEITNGTNILTGWKKSNGDNVALGADITNITTGAATTLTAQWESCDACNANNVDSVDCVVSVANNTCVYTTSCKAGYGNIQNDGTANASCTPNTITLSWTPDTTHGTISNAPASCTYGSTFTAATMTPKSGYTFTNWSVNGKTFASGATNISCNQNQLGVASGTATINPGFTTNAYNVSYNCNGGTAQSTLPATTSVSYGASYTTAANTVCTKTGYTLSGWMVGSSSSTDVKSPGEEIQWTYTADKTLYAKWTANISGEITLNSNRYTSTSASTAAQTATSASNPTYVYTKYNTGVYKNSGATTAITQLTSIPTMTGYTFNGFYTQKYTGGTQVVNSSGAFTSSAKTQVSGVGGTATWYAQWSACTACNPGTGATCSLSVVNNACVWTTSCMDGYDNLVGDGTATPECTANTISLTWDNNGYGTQPTTPSSCTYGQSFTTPSISGTGQTFSGWKRSDTTLTGGTSYVCNYTNLGTYDGSAEFTAQWNANSYSITYACGDGGGTPPSTTNISATYGSPFTAATNTCTWVGHTFTGWAVSNTGTPSTVWQNGTTWNYTENKTFTAQWTANQFKVRYANGATGATGTTPADGTCTYGTTCTAAANPYTYTGYTFGGWSCSLTHGGGSCAQATYDAGANIGNATAVNGGDITLTAIWNANTITLNWGNGGHGTLPSSRTLTCEYGSTFNMPAAMSATGYTFGGWTLNSTTYAADATVNCTNTVLGVSSGSVTITGKWTAKQSALTFDEQGGTGATKTKTATYGSAMPTLTSAQLPTRTGYTFVGYFDATSGGNQYYKYNGTSFRTWNKNTTAGTTLYARWTPNSYTVTLNKNVSSTDTTVVDTINATFGAAMPVVNASGNALTIPTNSNQIITGYADARSNGVLYYNVNGMNITSAKNWDKTTDNTTLYAQWETCAACNATNANCTLTVSNNTCTYETSCVAGYHGLVGENTSTPSCTAANTYTVQFVTGNNVVLGTQEFTYGESKALTEIANLDQTKIPVSSANGWMFWGWNKTPGYRGTGVNSRDYTNGATVSESLTTENGATVKLYGVWTRNVSFKYYSPASATAISTNTNQQQYYNSTATAAEVKPMAKYQLVTHSTYNWVPQGWVLGSASSTTTVTNDTTNATITPAHNIGTSNGVAYYALYKRPATIQYNVNGGTGSTDDTTADQYFNAGGTNSVPLNMTLATGTGLSKTNYSFAGWTQNQDGTGASYESGANYTFPATSWKTTQPSVTLYANWSQNTITCSAGQYLPANANACTQCTKGSYCPGGTYNLDNNEHGRTTCPTGYTSDAGASLQTQCYVNCGPGQYKASTTSTCDDVTANYWGAGGKSFYGSALPRTKCGIMNMRDANGTLVDAQLTTTGSGSGANEAADCGRVLHVGDYSLRLRSGTAATPSLKFDVDKNGAVDLWAKMTTTQTNMSSTSAKKFKMNYNNQTYYVCDDTTCSGN